MSPAELIDTDPLLAWQIARAVILGKVAGPWEDGIRVEAARGRTIAAVYQVEGDALPGWLARMGMSAYADSQRFPTEAEARAWCDARLVSGGWRLA